MPDDLFETLWKALVTDPSCRQDRYEFYNLFAAWLKWAHKKMDSNNEERNANVAKQIFEFLMLVVSQYPETPADLGTAVLYNYAESILRLNQASGTIFDLEFNNAKFFFRGSKPLEGVEFFVNLATKTRFPTETTNEAAKILIRIYYYTKNISGMSEMAKVSLEKLRALTVAGIMSESGAVLSGLLENIELATNYSELLGTFVRSFYELDRCGQQRGLLIQFGSRSEVLRVSRGRPLRSIVEKIARKLRLRYGSVSNHMIINE